MNTTIVLLVLCSIINILMLVYEDIGKDREKNYSSYGNNYNRRR